MGRMGAALAVPLVLAAAAAQAKKPARHHDTQSSVDDRLKAMENQMQQMAVRLGVLEDTEAIRRLHNAYGYYFDRGLHEAVVELFTTDALVQYGPGVYRGRAGIARLYGQALKDRWLGAAAAPVNGWLHDQLMLQDVIDVAADRRTAQARVRCFIQAGSHESRLDAPPTAAGQWWEGGLHENLYAKGDDGIWRIQSLRYYPVYQAAYEQGWAHAPITAQTPPALYPQDPAGPDEIAADGLASWPAMPVVAFHYPHPVTGHAVTG